MVIPHDPLLRLIEAGRIVSRRFTDPIFIDWEELFTYREAHKRAVATRILIPRMGLNNWVVVAQTTSMSLDDWLKLGDYEQEAIIIAVRDFLKKREDANKEAMNAIKSQIDSGKPHRNLFEGMPMPLKPS